MLFFVRFVTTHLISSHLENVTSGKMSQNERLVREVVGRTILKLWNLTDDMIMHVCVRESQRIPLDRSSGAPHVLRAACGARWRWGLLSLSRGEKIQIISMIIYLHSLSYIRDLGF